MTGYHDLEKKFKALGLVTSQPAIIHVAQDDFGCLRGGIQTLLGALRANLNSIITPAFTYRVMVIPEDGPQNNGMQYGSGNPTNELVEPYQMDMAPDPSLGAFPIVFSHLNGVSRSKHPILSFYGLKAEEYLSAQTLSEPLGIIAALLDHNGIVVLVNVDHSANTSIHLGERLANRHTFTRWALLPERVIECPNFPGCSAGFAGISQSLEQYSGSFKLPGLEVTAVPLRDVVTVTQTLIQADRQALLCQRPDCERCNTIRNT